MSHQVVRSVTVLFAFAMMVTFLEDAVVETLDLAEQAFDDQYLGCTREMERKLEENNVLDAENRKNEKFKEAWEAAKIFWILRKNNLKAKLPPGFKDNHGIALLAYTGFMRKDFNDAVKTAGRSYSSYKDNFDFKWLHFYITSALHLLSESHRHTHEKVYGGIDEDIVVQPNRRSFVKFGHFFYTSLCERKAKVMGNKSLLIFFNYTGVNIEDFAFNSCEQEVLIPGYEVFSLSPVIERKKYFEMKSSKTFCSNFNCAYITGEKSVLSVQECITDADPHGRRHGLK